MIKFFKRKSKNKEEKKESLYKRKVLLVNLIIALFVGPIIFIFSRNWIAYIISTILIFSVLTFFIFGREVLKKSGRIKKMETAFPDFLQLMSSNLRAGMTIDRALLLGSRKEFAPLDQEILLLGKDIVTGKKIEEALKLMAHRIKSEKIEKTITLIISGIRSGGNLAILLEETSRNMKQREFVEKRAASNILMYVIFIFFSTAVGAPILFGLSSILVEVLTNLLANLPEVETNISLPFVLTSINISAKFVKWFSLVFLLTIDILGSLIIGLVNKGEEKQGIKYMLPLLAISVTIFFGIRIILSGYFAGIFSSPT